MLLCNHHGYYNTVCKMKSLFRFKDGSCTMTHARVSQIEQDLCRDWVESMWIVQCRNDH